MGGAYGQVGGAQGGQGVGAEDGQVAGEPGGQGGDEQGGRAASGPGGQAELRAGNWSRRHTWTDECRSPCPAMENGVMITCRTEASAMCDASQSMV